MKLVAEFGTPTWSCDASDLSFVGQSFLVATEYEGRLYVFDVNTGMPTASWGNSNEQFNCVTQDGNNIVIVGGSFGSIYTLKLDRKKGIELLEERHVFAHIESVACSPKHKVVAASCFDQLKLLPHQGDVEGVTLTFSDGVNSLEWCEPLEVFLLLSGEVLFTVSPAGAVTELLHRANLQDVAYHESSDSLILLEGTSKNDGRIVKVDRRTGTDEWRTPVVFDHTQFGTIMPMELGGELKIVPLSGELVVCGYNWVGRFSPSGAIIGNQLHFISMVTALAVSGVGGQIAVASGNGLRVWDRHFAAVLP